MCVVSYLRLLWPIWYDKNMDLTLEKAQTEQKKKMQFGTDVVYMAKIKF